MKKIYLSGPMDSCDEYEMTGWRTQVKESVKDLYKTLDPCDRPLDIVHAGRPRIEDKKRVADIVEFDKADVDACDIVLAYVWKPSHGTSMELIYAWEQGKTIITVAPNVLSPWVQYHSHFVFKTVDEALFQLQVGVPIQRRFCLGFMFQNDLVVMIRKNCPDWQRGLLNGLGGKLEDGETPIQAMVREFVQESGYNTHPSEWKLFATMHTRWQTSSQRSYAIDLFAANARPGARFIKQTDEDVTRISWQQAKDYPVVYNVPFLLHMADRYLNRPGTPVHHLYHEDTY